MQTLPKDRPFIVTEKCGTVSICAYSLVDREFIVATVERDSRTANAHSGYLNESDVVSWSELVCADTAIIDHENIN